MNMQELLKVETADTYLDHAFHAATERAGIMRTKKDEKTRMDNLQKSRTIEKIKVKTVTANLTRALHKILSSFPNFSELPRFYQELVRLRLDFHEFKHSLGAVQWMHDKANELQRDYSNKIDAARTIADINNHRRAFYGRIASFLKQVDPQFKLLDDMRKILKEFPTIKTSMPTACLFGFPNVGKSTLLAKLTTAKPEIKAYPFTTKNINTGYLKEPGIKIQIIDAPGTLDRFEKMNDIEKQAYLAVKHCADLVVYVFDPTDEVPEEDQLKLLETVKKYCKEIVVYISKTDIADKKVVDKTIAAVKKEKIKELFTDIEELKKRLLLLPPKEKMPVEKKEYERVSHDDGDEEDDEDDGDDHPSNKYNKEE
ncbi:MAG: GTPase [Candidatus Woesearchaeota archaeon]|nr:GTPase [Candidatus Woesearchaeota archaeon]